MDATELLRGVRFDGELEVPGETVRRIIHARSNLIASVELLPPRTLRLVVALGPLMRPVDLHLREEFVYRPDDWLALGEISGPIGAVLRTARALKVKENVFELIDVRSGDGRSDTLFVNLPRLRARGGGLSNLPSDADLVISDLRFEAGNLRARALGLF